MCWEKETVHVVQFKLWHKPGLKLRKWTKMKLKLRELMSITVNTTRGSYLPYVTYPSQLDVLFKITPFPLKLPLCVFQFHLYLLVILNRRSISLKVSETSDPAGLMEHLLELVHLRHSNNEEKKVSVFCMHFRIAAFPLISFFTCTFSLRLNSLWGCWKNKWSVKFQMGKWQMISLMSGLNKCLSYWTPPVSLCP